jgi:hypothetical protein
MSPDLLDLLDPEGLGRQSTPDIQAGLAEDPHVDLRLDLTRLTEGKVFLAHGTPLYIIVIAQHADRTLPPDLLDDLVPRDPLLGPTDRLPILHFEIDPDAFPDLGALRADQPSPISYSTDLALHLDHGTPYWLLDAG